MAASFYKWLLMPLAAIMVASFSAEKPHPFHVSVTEINHNAADKTLEVSCKIFTDDFEKTLARKFNAKVDLGKQELHASMDTLIKKYLASAISVRPQGRAGASTYLRFVVEEEAAYCYFEIPNVPSATKIDVVNTILYDLFDDQVNIIHVTVKGTRKSDKVTYPSKEASFSF